MNWMSVTRYKYSVHCCLWARARSRTMMPSKCPSEITPSNIWSNQIWCAHIRPVHEQRHGDRDYFHSSRVWCVDECIRRDTPQIHLEIKGSKLSTCASLSTFTRLVMATTTTKIPSKHRFKSKRRNHRTKRFQVYRTIFVAIFTSDATIGWRERRNAVCASLYWFWWTIATADC